MLFYPAYALEDEHFPEHSFGIRSSSFEKSNLGGQIFDRSQNLEFPDD